MESKTVVDEAVIYNKIKEADGSGITLQQLSSDMGVAARQLSLILRKLIEKKKIAKRTVKENGKSVIKYFVIIDNENKEIYIKLENTNEIPCFACKNLFKCGNGSYISPQTCSKLSEWLFKKASSM